MWWTYRCDRDGWENELLNGPWMEANNDMGAVKNGRIGKEKTSRWEITWLAMIKLQAEEVKAEGHARECLKYRHAQLGMIGSQG